MKHSIGCARTGETISRRTIDGSRSPQPKIIDLSKAHFYEMGHSSQLHSIPHIVFQTYGAENRTPSILRDRLLSVFRIFRISGKTFDSVVRHECSIIAAHCTPKFVNGHFVLRNMRLLATIARALSIVFKKRSLPFIGRSGTTTEYFSSVKSIS